MTLRPVRPLLFLASAALLVASAGCSDGDGVPSPAAPGPGSPDPTEPDSTEPPPGDEGVVPELPPTFALFDVVPARGLSSGGEDVTLVGVGLAPGMSVYFGDTLAAPPYVPTSAVASVVTPPGVPGAVDVRVVHPDGEEWVLADGFRYHRPFGVASIEPDSGPLAGGVQVELIGHGFDDATAFLVGHRMLIGVEPISDTQVRGWLPPGELPGAVDVAVITDAGRSSLRGGFTYTEGLAVTSVMPHSGSAAGGQQVDVHGAGFTLDTRFRFGSALAALTSITHSGRRARVTVPPGPLGAVDVVALEQGETATLGSGYFYVDPESLGGPTEILHVWPPAGPTHGGILVSVVAAGLVSVPDTKLSFGGVEANIASLSTSNGLVTALLPAGAPGPVDVRLETSQGTYVRPAGFTYFAPPRVDAVAPDRGPATGGTAVVLEGAGFSGATSVRIGALFAPTFSVVSDARIEAVAPPGSPGWADVIVESPSGEGRLDAGYVFEMGQTIVLATDPDGAALPGGTLVNVIGADLPDQPRVFFDGVELTGVEALGPTIIRVVAPSWQVPASVDVTVLDANTDQGDTLENAFTYFNPAASMGGTWGPKVSGTLNVSVLDMWTSQGIPGAFVTLWTGEGGDDMGLADDFGNITFTGPSLQGEQMVTAWAPGYSASSVVEFDAENLTLLLFPSMPPVAGGGGGGGNGGFEPVVIRGRALLNDKYLIPPPGKCPASGGGLPIGSEEVIALDYLCEPCMEHADCGPAELGNQCTAMLGGEQRCTSPCATGADCPTGYGCLAVQAGQASRCMPVSSTVGVTCRLTTSAPFNSPPGGVVKADFLTGAFELTTGGGSYSVICQGEYTDPQTGEVTILAMGASPRITANSGDVIEDVEVPVDVAFTRPVTLTLHYPPSRLIELPHHRVRALIALGDYGFHEVVRGTVDPSDGQLRVPRMPEGLTGSLSGARWYVMGGAYSENSSFVQWFPPYSTAILRELPGLGESHLYRVDSSGALQPHIVGTKPLADVFGLSSDFAVAVGDAGAIYRFDGSGWSFMGSPLGANWRAVWGAAPDAFWAVGEGGRLARWNGAVWTLVDTLPFEPRAIGGTSAQDVLVVGDGGNGVHFDGVSWTPIPLGTTVTLRGIWGDASTGELWVVGDGGALLRREVEAAPFVQQSVSSATDFYAIAGNADGTLVVGGDAGELRRRVGDAWPVVDTADGRSIRALWVSAGGAVAAVGERGLALSISPAGVLTSHSLTASGAMLTGLWGHGEQPRFAVGRDSVLVGPLFEVPKFASPISEGVLTGPDLAFVPDGGPISHFNWFVIGQPWWRPKWQVLTEGSVSSVQLPKLGPLVGADPLAGAAHYLELTRGFIEGFDIDNFEYINLYFRQDRWDAWSVNSTFVTAP